MCDELAGTEIVSQFCQRIKQGKLTIQENQEDHFCVYFAAHDLHAKEVFIGHHKKSDLWLFNGGHIDDNETIQETLNREIKEEWGLEARDFAIPRPARLTITPINNPSKQTCRKHYDIWVFIPVEKDKFQPRPECLAEEFHEAGWKSAKEACALTKEENTFKSIEFLAQKYF